MKTKTHRQTSRRLRIATAIRRRAHRLANVGALTPAQIADIVQELQGLCARLRALHL